MVEHATAMRAPAGSRDRSSRLDWARIAAWTQQVARGDLRDITAVFEANGALAPRVLWRPKSYQIPTPQLRFLLDYWTHLKGDAPLPAGRSVARRALAPVAAYESLLDAVDDGRDFFHRRCATVIADLMGHDMAGKLLSEYEHAGLTVYMVESALAIYRAAYLRAEPVYLDRAPAGAVTTGWHKLLLPLADDAGNVAGFIQGTVPIGAAGLPF